MTDKKEINAGILIIGNEVLSGRTKDVNTSTLATWLNSLGIKVNEVRVIPDIEKKSDNYHIDLMSQVASIALEEDVRNIWEKAITEKEILKTFQ